MDVNFNLFSAYQAYLDLCILGGALFSKPS